MNKHKTISIYAIILPRLEVFFLEEWIDHHLALGVDKVYLYNNGFVSIDASGSLIHGARKLKPKEEKIKWAKRPNLNYNLNLTDKEITKKLYSLEDKFKGKVKIIEWKYGINHEYKYPESQKQGFYHCKEKFKSDWWLNIDPDEFVVLKKCNSLKDLCDKHKDITCFRFKQRVFDSRNKKQPVREVFNWGFERGLPKCLIINDIIDDIKKFDIHFPNPRYGIIKVLEKNEALFYHYQGFPEIKAIQKDAIRWMKKNNETDKKSFVCLSKKDLKFNKLDYSMKKYLKKETKQKIGFFSRHIHSFVLRALQIIHGIISLKFGKIAKK
jgi:hypothetical protein